VGREVNLLLMLLYGKGKQAKTRSIEGLQSSPPAVPLNLEVQVCRERGIKILCVFRHRRYTEVNPCLQS
jgi:hypothetical protein